jgi:hypothetical protein
VSIEYAPQFDTHPWTQRLAKEVAAAVRHFQQSKLKDCPVVVFDLGCFPWHGSIELSFLTAAEADADPKLFDPSAIAAWDHYDFAGENGPWPAGKELGKETSDLYHKADDARESVVDAFLRASAAAVATPEVSAALNELTRDPRFQIWVLHPDTDQAFWPLT